MVVNAVAPWEGQLIWVGQPNGGQSQSGQEWKSVEFALKYADMRLQEKHIVFNAFGVDIVNKILSLQYGTTVRVTWSPDARQSQDGRWFGKLQAFGIHPINQTAQNPQQNQTQAPQTGFQMVAQQQYPQQGTQILQQAPAYQPPTQPYSPQPAPPANVVTPPADDLPW